MAVWIAKLLSQFIPFAPSMIFKIIIAYLVLPLIAASLEKDGNADSNSGVPASAKSLHLSVTTGTPGVWYPGKRTFSISL